MQIRRLKELKRFLKKWVKPNRQRLHAYSTNDKPGLPKSFQLHNNEAFGEEYIDKPTSPHHLTSNKDIPATTEMEELARDMGIQNLKALNI
jgi:hypothetical protein